VCAAALLIAGCASQGPVVYPSSDSQGSATQLQVDIEACINLANENSAIDDQTGRVAKRTATNFGIGAGTGAVAGAFGGGLGRGALIGAVTTGVGTMLHGAFSGDEPSPIHKKFVSHCLTERGHKVIGWN
jgi:hypothetical protein